MPFNYETNFEALENNIIEIIKEEQIKLGYRSETIRLYYPMESLNNILGKELAINELQEILGMFCDYVSPRLGKVEQSNVNTRFCIVIPPKGVTYVQEEVEERYFLREFIEKISTHHCSLEGILEVFHHHSNCVKCETITNGEFDYLIYFEDGQPDSYQYCIKFEDCHAIYHRYTKADYVSFGF